MLKSKLVRYFINFTIILKSREMESKWGKTSEIIQIEHNLEQVFILKTVFD